jgi:hypothetical protein
MRSQAGVSGSTDGEEDALLMAAIQQSQAAALAGGTADVEVDRILRQTEAEEGRRLVQEQDTEFEESLAMDQIRAAAEAEAQEQAAIEEQRRLEELERLQAEESSRKRLEEERVAAALRALEEKRSRLPAEPPVGETGRVALLFRLPSGQKKQRAFRSSDCVSSLYDFVEVEESHLAENTYCLVSQVPRRVYRGRDQTLEAAGVENQSVILAEVD